MRLLEHESKELLKRYKIPVPTGYLIKPGEAIDVESPVMMKVQIPIGGRGKAGGVLKVSTTAEAREKAGELFASRIRGYQTNCILIEDGVDVEQEYFMAITYDTLVKAPLVIFSTEGGVDIEALAEEHPEKVIKETFTCRGGLPQYKAREIISQAGVSGKMLIRLGNVLSQLATLFLDYDATIAEINPLALTTDGKLIALDCHIDIEEDALYRHADMAALDKDESRVIGENTVSDFERQAVVIDEADHRGVAGRVIEFDGTMGLIIGGGGASLTAFDAIKAHGGKPANYCEIGGNPSVIKVQKLTTHILSKPGVEKISVIMNVVSNTRVDLVARGVIKGILEAGKQPSETLAVFRIPGAQEDEGFKILKKYGVTFCDRTVSIDGAAKIAVEKLNQ
jgi:succinyl-CoA synthetase beta subunit